MKVGRLNAHEKNYVISAHGGILDDSDRFTIPAGCTVVLYGAPGTELHIGVMKQLESFNFFVLTEPRPMGGTVDKSVLQAPKVTEKYPKYYEAGQSFPNLVFAGAASSDKVKMLGAVLDAPGRVAYRLKYSKDEFAVNPFTNHDTLKDIITKFKQGIFHIASCTDGMGKGEWESLPIGYYRKPSPPSPPPPPSPYINYARYRP